MFIVLNLNKDNIMKVMKVMKAENYNCSFKGISTVLTCLRL